MDYSHSIRVGARYSVTQTVVIHGISIELPAACLPPDVFYALRGVDGRSAYQLAVANGFVGTEQQWLASLVGDDASVTQAAVLTALGYTPGRAVNVQAFAASGTWTKPAGTTYVVALVIGGGGGGGAGACDIAGTARVGGGAGAGGARGVLEFLAANLPATVSVVVGAGGNGATGRNTTGTGATGSGGNASTFGNWLRSPGGNAGAGGGNGAGGTGGAAAAGITSGGGTGGAASITGGSASTGGTANYGSTGGGGGGGILVGNTRGNNGSCRGGAGILLTGLTDVDLAPPSFSVADGMPGVAGNSLATHFLGTGGSGGASSLVTNAGAGGLGGAYGGGGGGGGAAVTGTGTSGNGGNGGSGYVVVYSW